MQQLRGSLTRLKKKMSDKLVGDADLYGYAGVNKTELLSFIDQSYGLTLKIEELRGSFSIVAVKRKLSSYLEECNNFLDEEVDGDKVEKKFNHFLISLTHIHDEIALAYTIYCSQSLRTEADVENYINILSKLKNSFDESKATLDMTLTTLETITELNNKSVKDSEAIGSLLEEAEETIATLGNLKATATVNAEIITKHETETKEQKERITSLSAGLSTLEKKFKNQISESSSYDLSPRNGSRAYESLRGLA